MREATVYRAYDADGQLLYVGCCYRFHLRKTHHRHHALWGRNAARWTEKRYPSRREAEKAELAAIRSEKPLHNRVGVTIPSHLDRGQMSVQAFADEDDAYRRECFEAASRGDPQPPYPKHLRDWLDARVKR